MGANTTGRCRAALLALAALAMLPMPAAKAQDAAQFYAGKSIDLEIGYSVGGGYDLYARLVAQHLGDHIPGHPTIVPRNMEGAASLRLANYLYAAAPRDGTAIGAISRGAAFDPLLNENGAQFDASKFSWIGSANNEVSVCVALQSSGITSFNDVLTKPLTIGATGVGDDTYQFPALMNAELGTKFKIVTGYPGGNDITLALERGEVQGRCGWSWSSIVATRMNWITDKKIVVLVQMSLSKHPDLPDVPLIMDLAKTDEQRQIFKLIFARQVMGRPFAAPPGVPADRLAVLRRAFADTMKDKAFLADAEKRKFEINPVSGEEIQALVHEVYQTPAAVTKKAAAILGR
ncbi:MAG TPA: tripartite tricarboxylate transporter substrate-binding protein [Xanthobacteraceae bacterium]|nr:tripartite tricarboxylate transporter substrate-binding protein [Xanthobacteraceae bacterium]